eukprot:11415_1
MDMSYAADKPIANAAKCSCLSMSFSFIHSIAAMIFESFVAHSSHPATSIMVSLLLDATAFFPGVTIIVSSSSSHCHKLIGHKSCVTSISFYPDREFFVSASDDNTVRLWSTELGGQCLSWYRGHCSRFGMWSTDKGVPIRIFAGHVSDVECVRFHPNCNYLVSGSSDRTIRCWDIQSGDCVRLMTGHTNAINDLQFTSDGRCVVSASKDNTIRVWDIATSECISVLQGHTDDVTKIALAHTVNRNAVVIEQNTNDTNVSSFPLVISSGMDNTIRFWDVNNPQKPLIKTINTNM